MDLNLKEAREAQELCEIAGLTDIGTSEAKAKEGNQGDYIVFLPLHSHDRTQLLLFNIRRSHRF